MPRFIRFMWVLEIVICGFSGLAAVAALIRGNVPFGIGLVVFTAIAIACFEWRKRALQRSLSRARSSVEAMRTADLENGSPVRERARGDFENELASNRFFAHSMSSQATRFYTRGSWRGKALDIGTAVVSGRDGDVFLSHVLVEGARFQKPFRVMSKGMLTSLARIGSSAPSKTGDEAFDDVWVVDAEGIDLSAVLSDEIRQKLIELQSRVGAFQVASIESTDHGLLLRWPGEIDVHSAAYLRDFTLQIAERLSA